MKIFVSLKVPRRIKELKQLAHLTSDAILQAGHEPFVAPQEIAAKGLNDPGKFMPFVRQQVKSSDLMIVLYHSELRGGLIEMGLAYAHGIPIWLCYKFGERVSSSALGCTSLIMAYADTEELQKKLTANLREFSLKESSL
jgi:hypothetical protein